MKSPGLAAAFALSLLGGALSASPESFGGYTFNALVKKSSGMPYREFFESGRPTLRVRPNEEYSIVVRNPLPVRAAVAVSIDGLNSIDGQRSSPRNARKWMVEPNSSITIEGWQTGGASLRKFVFTGPDASYANWREDKDGKPYTKNLGVIGVAWFWNKAELDQALNPPQPFANESSALSSAGAGMGKRAASAPRAMGEDRAGTGMGREERHPVTQVDFDADAGMFSVRDVMKIFYVFAKEPKEPLPFVDESEEHERFSPDMYK